MSKIKKTEAQFEKVMDLLDDFLKDENTSKEDIKAVKAELKKTVSDLKEKMSKKEAI